MDLNPVEPDLSVVVPLLNEENNLRELHSRLKATLEPLGKAYEIIMVDDGSRDGSFDLLVQLRASDPCLKIIRLRRNFGQHPAAFAGFERARGRIVVSLDADLQNPPEEIPKLLRKLEEGFDVVSGRRVDRKDPWLRRKLPSMLVNQFIARRTGLAQTDSGCFLKAYTRTAALEIARWTEHGGFFMATIGFLGFRYAEVDVSHAERRGRGGSRYDVFTQLNMVMSLFTGYARRPFQVIEIAGGIMLLAGIAALFLSLPGILPRGWVATVLYLHTAVLGLLLGSVGIIGEFAIRIYNSSRGNPRYIVERIIE